MKFGEKIKRERLARKMQQTEFAKFIGVSPRTVSYYETFKTYPRTKEDYKRIADILEVDVDYLLSDNEEFILKAKERYGYQGQKDAEALTEEVTALFSGGDLADEDLDEMMKAIQDAYWIAKEKNKKYGKNKA